MAGTENCLFRTLKIANSGLPVIVAEIGANHDGDMRKALKMIKEVSDAGATLVKFQLYTSEELVADGHRLVNWGPPSCQTQEPIGEMFRRLSLPKEEMAELFAFARSLSLTPFATPFSEAGVDFLLSLDVPFFKIAASDVNHLPLLEYVARTGKPVFLSLGKCTLAEADIAVTCLFENGCKDLALLHCVAAYPSPMSEMNLRVIPMLSKLYPECVIGFSDHSIGITAALAAVALGAQIVEKHVTISQKDAGPDHWFSINMQQLTDLVEGVRDVYCALGSPRKRILETEKVGRENATRSIIAARDISPGERLSHEDIKIVRPGTGIPPRFKQIVTGMTARKAIQSNRPLQWDDFK